MSMYQTTYMAQIRQEIEQTPEEYLPLMLEVIRLLRQNIGLKPAEESFEQGWQEVLAGETLSLAEVWVGIGGDS